MPARSRMLLLVPFIAASIRPAIADLTPEMVKRCKQATGLVRVVDEAEGTAFHIGDGGLFTGLQSSRTIVVLTAFGGRKTDLLLFKTMAQRRSAE